MKRLLPFLICLLFITCSKDDKTELQGERLRRVVVAYVMGENSLSNAAETDLNEIRSAASLIPDNCKFIVFYDNSNSAVSPQIISFDNKEGETLLYEYDEDVVSTDSATMQTVLQFVIEKNPADEYALILWSHGSGWLPANRSKKSIGIDNGANTMSNTGTEMDISTLRGVLENTGICWKYIFYDACFMQCIEVAYELRNVTQWSIGSPAEIPSDGADYTIMMPCFFEEETFAKDITEQYYNIYWNNYGVLLSAIRSDRLENFARATVNSISSLSYFPVDDVQKYCVYSVVTGWEPEYYDIGSCIYHWMGESGYASWQTEMELAIPYRYSSSRWRTSFSSVFDAQLSDAGHYAGASLYLPVEGRDSDNDAWRKYGWYQAAGYLFDR